MGLDMWLTKEISLDADESRKVHKVLDSQDADHPTTLQVEVIYWRKVNAIHAWFIKQNDGEEPRGNLYVSLKDLQGLHDVIVRVLSNHDLAPSLLPTMAGFFFGSTEYDEYYFDELERTRKILEKELSSKMVARTTYYYTCSW